MPGRDGSGPLGRGPVTGRGLGFCNLGRAVKYGAGMAAGLGLGLGLRRGWGRGMGWGLNSTDAKTQRELLSEQKELLQERLNAISKQLEDL